MKLHIRVYNPEIGHCMGNGNALCGRCLRRALYDTWRHLGDSRLRESIIMMPPKASAVGCELRIFMPYGYEGRRKGRAQVELTSRTSGVAV